MTDGKVEAARITTGAGMLVVSGLTLNDWVLIATITYFLIQIIILFPRFIAVVRGFVLWLRDRKKKKDDFPEICDSLLPDDNVGFFRRAIDRIKSFFMHVLNRVCALFRKLK